MELTTLILLMFIMGIPIGLMAFALVLVMREKGDE